MRDGLPGQERDSPRSRIGLIADTHGLLRPQAIACLAGCDLIIHAGDIGPRSILDTLRQLAPTYAVRGNNDTTDWFKELPDTLLMIVAGRSIRVVHDARTLAQENKAGHDILISGHSHRPRIEQIGSVLSFNPGSAGPRRFSLPVSMGFLVFDENRVDARILHL